MTDIRPSALQGRRVLELADEKGAYCGKLFADMGADVIKIERPGGDASRRSPPLWRGEGGSGESLSFLYTNTSKRAVTLDLEKAEGRELFVRLVETADVVLETFPPGFLDELGLGYGHLRRTNPALVFSSITGFGQTGPQRGFRSSDLVAGALGGALYVTGEADDPPVTLAGQQYYTVAGLCAASATMIALLHASRVGRGQHVDVSAEETTVSLSHICGIGKWLDDGIVPRRMGTALFASVPSGTYTCRDGLVYLMVNRPAHWKALAEWIHEECGIEEVMDPMFEGPSSRRLPHRELLDIFIRDLTARHSVEEIYHQGQQRHIAFTPVNGLAEVARDPQLAARGYFVDLPHGNGVTLRFPGAPYRCGETPWRVSRRAPAVGEHNAEIYGGELGLSGIGLRELEERGII